MKRFLLICVVVLLPVGAWAAYQNPVIERNELQPNGMAKLFLLFSGNAGEPDVRAELLVRPGMTFQQGRHWVDDKLTELDAAKTAASAAQLQPGQTISRLSRPPVVPTAKEVWRKKFNAYMAAKDSGLAGATLTSELAAKKADLEATYQAGFLDD